MREGMGYDDATEYVEFHDETLISDIIYILRHVKGASAADITKMTMEEIRYFSLLAQEDLRKAEKSGGNT